MAATAPKAPKAASDKPVRAFHKTDHKRVKAGHIMAMIDFVLVDSIGKGQRSDVDMHVTNLTDNAPSFTVEGSELINNAMSADLYEEEVHINGTQAEDIFGVAYNKPFTVFYTKDDGEDRTLRGRLVERDKWRGRCMCIDFDVVIDAKKQGKKDSGIRWVNNREIHWFIMDGVKYVIK